MAEETPPPSPKSARTQAGVREVGYAVAPESANDWWQPGGIEEETTPELAWPLNLAVYDAMRKQDAQVGSVLRAVTFPVRSTTWRIDPNGARDEVVQHVAGDLGLPIKGVQDVAPGRLRDRFSWSTHLRHSLLMLPFGHMAFEQLYRYDEAANLLHLRKLGPRMPRSIAKFNVARDGGLISIEQKGVGTDPKDITIPVSRLVMYVNEREGGNWRGMSLLRTAYKNWLLKDRLLRTETMTIDRNGLGVPVYTAAEGEKSLDAGQDIASGFRSGDNAGAAIPNGALLKLLGVDGQLPDARKPIEYHDQQIARAVLAHFLNLGTQTGSWALGSTFADFFTQSLTAVAQDVADVTTAHVIEDLVDLNYGENEPAPKLVFDEIGSNAGALAVAIKTLVDAGVLTPDEGLEAHVRLGLGLPTKTEGDTRDNSAA
ncbi:hypothetical protein G7075_00035 [Phycicoccus sp. HDW14]|uniref:phage portal protein family protein n=1 Tax=Phycicoccus sp. HDW14 TaxID=2714941 RepID=UPI00140C81BD|nr:hypothetical protein [Phycicoccus sp. HDW14]QIM19885.1 hypothetical protein G7075_00035 [Phycicoccus sp. HDW14]